MKYRMEHRTCGPALRSVRWMTASMLLIALVVSLFSAVGVRALSFKANDAPTVRPTIIGQELVYPNGVMVSLDAGTGLMAPTLDPDVADSAAVIPCDPGWLCIYEDTNYGGRRLQWSDPQQDIDLRNHGFNDEMSSWRNRTNYDAHWFYDVFSGTRRCMNAHTENSNVGSGDNDEATSLRIYTDDRAC